MKTKLSNIVSEMVWKLQTVKYARHKQGISKISFLKSFNLYFYVNATQPDQTHK